MASKFWRQSKKTFLLMGETKDKIAKTAEKLGFTDYEFVESLQEAVSRGAELASEGDAVLLSPACASWDMFDSYEQRGTLFKRVCSKFIKGVRRDCCE